MMRFCSNARDLACLLLCFFFFERTANHTTRGYLACMHGAFRGLATTFNLLLLLLLSTEHIEAGSLEAKQNIGEDIHMGSNLHTCMK